MVRRPLSRVLLLGCVLSGCVISGCAAASDGDDGGGDAGGSEEATCDRAIALIRDCGLLGEGEFACLEPRNEAEACRRACVLEARCTDLAPLLCPAAADPVGVAIAMQMGVGLCRSACPLPDGCPPTAVSCDGIESCTDGSDERDCPLFACDDGSEVPAGARCDGAVDCGDGSDEDGCAAPICESGHAGHVPPDEDERDEQDDEDDEDAGTGDAEHAGHAP